MTTLNHQQLAQVQGGTEAERLEYDSVSRSTYLRIIEISGWADRQRDTARIAFLGITIFKPSWFGIRW